MTHSILILDGDAKPNEAILTQLKLEFDAEACTLAKQAFERIRLRPPDLLLVDRDLPDMAGMDFLRILRESERGKDLPVLLMASRKTVEGVLEAYGLGVDDYLLKPFDPRELMARVRALLRRKYERAPQWDAPISIGGIELDRSRRLCMVDGVRVVLRPREFEVLEVLMRKEGRVLTRAYLLETVWGMSSSANTRAVDVTVSRLRRCLGPRAGRWIETLTKAGYCFRKPL